MDESDSEILLLFRKNDVNGLKRLYDKYYVSLYMLAIKYIGKKEVAEEIVQDVFIQLWEKRQVLDVTSSFKSYLSAAIKYKSINYLKSIYKKYRFTELIPDLFTDNTFSGEEEVIGNEFSAIIKESIKNLPPKCRIIFNLSRNFSMSYDEIAVHLSISKRTVQAQIGIALKRIRKELKEDWYNIP